MRNFISILLIISLSWVTTGYACQMDGLATLRSKCCCPHAHEAKASAGQEQASAAEAERCCDPVFSSALDAQQPGLASASLPLDLPALAALPPLAWQLTVPVLRLVGAHPPARGPPGVGTRTYLATARLRL